VAADYRALAQLVALGSQWMEGRVVAKLSPEQAKVALQRSKQMVQAVEATWTGEQRPPLELPDDLFVPQARPMLVSGVVEASAAPPAASNVTPKPPARQSGTQAHQADSIRKAIHTFNDKAPSSL
jgi:hypothetical protein